MRRIIIGCIALLLCIATWLYTKSEPPTESQVVTVRIIEETPMPTIEPTPTPIPEPKEEMPEYNVPLDKDLQRYIYESCKEYGIQYESFLALIKTESSFNQNLIHKNDNGTIDIGLCQINSFNFKWLSKELVITDFFDPYQNIKAGLYMLSIAYHTRNDDHLALTQYNMGASTTNKLISRGITSSIYSRRVLENREIIEGSKLSNE